MSKIKIEDQEIELVSGGVLLEGWEQTTSFIIKLYKEKYGEEGKQKVKDLMLMSLNDPTSPIEEEDMATIYKYIDDNWDLI